MTRPLGLKSVSNPLSAEGGTDPEAASAARQSIPLTTRTLGRAVSVLDYEDFARAFSGIAKAQAGVLQVTRRQTVAITLAAPLGEPLTPASPVWSNLLGALKASGDPHVAVTCWRCRQSTFRVGLKVKCDPDYESAKVLSAVEAALRAHFSFDARELGQPVQQSDVIATAQAVPGVVAVDLDAALWRHAAGAADRAVAAGPAAGVAHARRERRCHAGRAPDARSRAVRRPAWRMMA